MERIDHIFYPKGSRVLVKRMSRNKVRIAQCLKGQCICWTHQIASHMNLQLLQNMHRYMQTQDILNFSMEIQWTQICTCLFVCFKSVTLSKLTTLYYKSIHPNIFDSYKLKMICKEKEKTKLCVYKRKSGSGRSGNFSDQIYCITFLSK